VATRTKEIDIDALLDGVTAESGRIQYRDSGRSVPPRATQHDTDVWKTYESGQALAYPVPVLAVNELRLRLGRSVRYLCATHAEELEALHATAFKLTMRVEDTSGNLIGNGLPNNNPGLKAFPGDTLVLLHFKMHAPLNRGRRVKQTRRRGRKSVLSLVGIIRIGCDPLLPRSGGSQLS